MIWPWLRVMGLGAVLAFGLCAQDPETITVNLTPRPKRPAPVDTGPKPLLRVDSSLVLIPVHVSNAVGRAVSGLARENFRVFEDGTEQTISDFFTEDAPVSIGLLFDASGSMRPKMEKSSEAASAFFRAAN